MCVTILIILMLFSRQVTTVVPEGDMVPAGNMLVTPGLYLLIR